MDYGKKKKMKDGGMTKKKPTNTNKRKVDTNLTLREDVATQAMKKAAKTAAGLGAAIGQGAAKDKSPKGFRGDPKKEQGMKKGGMAKKKMMGGGMAMKYKHGGKVGKKCPRDGIAMKGKTRA